MKTSGLALLSSPASPQIPQPWPATTHSAAASAPGAKYTSKFPAATGSTTFTFTANPASKSSRAVDGLTGRTTATSAWVAQGTATLSIPYLREALHSLDAKMASLKNQRQELESRLEQAVRLQSPVQRLPSELLSTIFTIGVFGFDEQDSVMVSTLMLVCRYWADVALKTPVLWSIISVSNHDSLGKARRKLARSKSVPLDITINFSPRAERSDGVTENVIHAMDLVRPALWRTKSFRLSVPNRALAHAALLRCQEDAPMLEFLSIRIFFSMQEDHYTSFPLPLFNSCTPRLRSCSFTSFNFGWDTRLACRLRILKLEGYHNGSSPSVETLIGILRQCSELEELALRNMSDVEVDSCSAPEEEIDLPKVIQLRRLTKASFYYAGVTRTRLLLGQISFPALETLELYYFDNLTPILHHLRTQSLTSLPLRSLKIESSFFNELTLVKLLGRLPSLVNLELVDVEDVTSNFLQVGRLLPSQCSLIFSAELVEPASRLSLGLPEADDTQLGRMHDARLGLAPHVCRISPSDDFA
jgi:hypothetical protein